MDKVEKMSIRQMWSFCLFQSKRFRLIKYVLVLGAVSGASVAYINSFLYAGILDRLLEGMYDAAADLVILLVVCVLIAELTERATRRIFDHYAKPSEAETKKRTASKAFSMEYEKIENTEILQSFRRVRQGENGHGGIEYQMHSIYWYFQELAKTLFAAAFVCVLILKTDFTKEQLLQFVLSTAILLLAFAGVMLISRHVSAQLGEMDLKMNRKNERTNAEAGYGMDILDSEECAQDIRLYGLSDYMMKKYSTIIQALDEILRFGRASGRKNGMLAFFLQLLVGLVYIYISLKAIAGSISTGEVLMYAGAITTMMNGIRVMMARRIEINYSNEYLKSYEEFINKPDMQYEGTLPIEKRIDNRYELELRNVSFHYPGTEEDIIKNLSIRFKVGEKLALVGRNGAGKTTLIKLLLRLYEPTEGQILLNGIDICKYDYDEYVKIFSVVFQDFNLFHFPLDENIAGSEHVDEEKVRNVLDQVGLTERVAKMHNGMHTLLYHETGDGEALSGGEAQKVAIARALYKDAPFIILDEPTAALDPIAEAEIYENFNELIGGKTSIYISHRMSSCKFCDKIVV